MRTLKSVVSLLMFITLGVAIRIRVPQEKPSTARRF